MDRRLLPDLLHLALADEWEAARAAGAYARSTRGASLDDVGFVHCSFVWQVEATAARFYDDVDSPLVLLRVDPARLTSPVRVEPAPGGGEHFPHVYGPLDLDAVVEVLPLAREDGRWVLPVELR